MKPLYASFRDSFHKTFYHAEPDRSVIGAPTVGTTAEADFLSTVHTEQPQSVLFYINEQLLVIDEAGTVIAPLYDCLAASDCFVPILCLEDMPTLLALSAFVMQNRIADATVCVRYANRALLSEVRLHMPLLRRMVDCRHLTHWENEESCYALAGDVWEAHSATVILPEALCDRHAVSTLQSRFVQVWGAATEQRLPAVILSGVNGVICQRPTHAYRILDTLPADTVTRRVFVYAHKGFQNEGEFPENTVTAIRKACEMGMDAAEMDIKLSNDGVPVLMHDNTTNNMVIGEEHVIETLSWEQLRRYERARYPGEYLDRLEDALLAIKGCGHFPAMIEFKPSPGYHHVERMADLVRDFINEHGMEYQTLLIVGDDRATYDYVQSVLPRIPKIMGLWEDVKTPTDLNTVESMLYRFSCRMQGMTALPSFEDVMVNRFFQEQAKLHGIVPTVWMRGCYYIPSVWEDAKQRADDALSCGFHSSCSDHAARYFHLPLELIRGEDGKAYGKLRNGSLVEASDAFPIELGNGAVAQGLTVTLPTGKQLVLVTEAYAKE